MKLRSTVLAAAVAAAALSSALVGTAAFLLVLVLVAWRLGGRRAR